MLCVILTHNTGETMKENKSRSTPKSIQRIFISWLIVVSLILITVVPVYAGLTQKQSSLDQPATLGTASETPIVDSTDSSKESNEIVKEEEIETTMTDTGDVLEESTEIVSSSHGSTQTISTPEQPSITDIEASESAIDLLPASNDEDDTNSATLAPADAASDAASRRPQV